MSAVFATMEENARTLLHAFQAGEDAAVQRAYEHLPQVKYGSLEEARDFPLSLRDAQTIIAREHGVKSWGELKLPFKLQMADYGEALGQFISLVYAGDADGVDALLVAEPRLRDTLDDPHFHFGSTAVIIAKHNLALVETLLKHGADINARSQWWAGDFSVLEGASARAAQQLIERGAIVTAHAAAEQGWLDWLDDAYASDRSIIHARGGDGKTPLHYATDPAVMDWLLERGADLEARDIDHASTPLQWQLGAGNHSAAQALAERGAQVDLFAAITLGELDLAQQALALHPQAIRARINQAGYELVPQADGSHQYVYAFEAAGMSPFQVALECERDTIFDWLLEQASPKTRLLAHCARGDADSARRIADASPGLVGSLPEADQRQLIHAAWTGNEAVVALMAALGFDLHIRDDDKMTPLHSAAFHGFAGVIAALLAADAAPPLDWLNGYGGTPLTTALYGRQHSWRDAGDFPAAIKLLIDAGSEVRAQWLATGDDEIDALLRSAL
ncbi:MAG: hypothetical protein OXE46_02870 [Chloroflexi bacterium]|nr:hypothetical protein [Chloroflexota bacterium]